MDSIEPKVTYPKGYMTPQGLEAVKLANADILTINALRRQQRNRSWDATQPAPLPADQPK